MTAQDSAVSIRGLCKSYEEGGTRRMVLDQVEADFQAGAMHAVMGRSGSGKTTLLNLIAGLDTADAGTIDIGGVAMTGLDERQRTLLRRRHIGIVFQFFNLIPSLTVAENVMLPLELNKLDDRVRRVQQALRSVELEARRNSYPAALSGGEQQRVAIARALVHRPRLIVADEPTGNLDERSARKVIETLSQARGQFTVVIVTHSMEMARHCDHKWQLKLGALETL